MITIIPNQTFAQRKKYIDRLITDRELMQLANATDVQRLQVQRGVISARSTFAHGAFTKTGGFTGSGSSLLGSGAGTATANSGITAGKTYEIRFTATFNTIDNTGGYRVKLNNAWQDLPDATGGAYSILSGRITLYYYVSSLTTADLVFETSGTNTDITISGISVTRIADVRCDILDENLDVLDSNPFTITTYNTNNLADINVDWSLCSSNGRRYLHVANNVNFNTELLTNSTFATDITGWTAEGGGTTHWVWSALNGGQAYWDGTGTLSTLAQSITAQGGAQYTISYTATGLALDGSESLGLTVKVNGTTVHTESYTQTGTYTTDIDLSDYEGQFVTLLLVFRPGSTGQIMGISGVSLKRTQDLTGITTPTHLLTEHLNTKLFYGTNDGNAFGFDFTGFYFRMRCRSRVEYTKYADSPEMASFSDNSNDLTLAYPEKQHTITVYGLSEYQHDCMRLMRLSDTFTIDDVEYVQAGEYTIKRTEHLNAALGQFDVKDKTGIERNTYSNA